MHKKEFIAHIGFPKCASSTLQRNLFTLDKKAELISPHKLSNVTGQERIQPINNKTILHDEILKFIDGCNDDYLKIKKSLNELIKNSKKRIIFTSEWVIGTRLIKNNFQERLDLFAELIPCDAKIILIVREHFDLIISLYRDNQKEIEGDKSLSIEKFFEMFLNERYKERIEFKKVYQNLLKYFKAENIYVYKLYKNSNRDISQDINKDFKFADNDSIKKTTKTNLGISTNQFIYLKIIRNFSFLKKFIPYFIYIKVHHIIMNLFKSDKSIKFNFSNKLKEKVYLAFEDDWTYICKKSRN